MRYSAASPIRPIPLDPQPSAERVAAAWASYCSASPLYAAPALDEIARAYHRACQVAGLDVWLVLAQVAHETGRLTSFWCARPRRNPAGIGVNGEKRATPHPTEPEIWPYNPERLRFERGYSYARWDPDAVEAHVARLLWYVQASPFVAERAELVARGLGERGMPAAARGSARIVRQLGWFHNPARLRGMGWAKPGVFYGDKLAAHANALRGAV